MKKISLLVMAVVCSVIAFAQDSGPQLRTPMAVKTRFGVRGGLNLAQLHLEDIPASTGLEKTQSKTSFNAGVFVNIPIGGMFRFQPEVSVSSQGGKYEGSNGTSLGEQDLHYINVPLNFQLQTPGGFFVQTGPQVGYLFEAKVKDQTGNAGSMDNKSDFDKIDFAWTAGVGYLARFGLGIDARYNYGLANILDDNNTDFTGGKMRNRVAQISLVYHFNAFK